MLVYFIRHGESENNSLGIYTGHMDVGLTARGVEEARAIRDKLSDKGIQRVYSSDLSRAVSTAVEAIPGCEPILDKRLREINIGSLSGKKIKEFRRDNPDLVPYLNKRDYTVFGGECDLDVLERLRSFIAELSSQPYDAVAVFCHGGLVHTTLEYALGVSFSPSSTHRPNCMIAVYELSADKSMKLLNWNL